MGRCHIAGFFHGRKLVGIASKMDFVEKKILQVASKGGENVCGLW